MATAAVDLELERAEPGVLPPGPRVPALVQFLHLGFRPIAFLEECDRRYGTPFTLRVPARPPLVMFSDPEAIREIFTGDPELLRAGEANDLLEPMLGQHSLLLLDGPRHLRQRRLMLPPFHGERMQAYGRVMGEIADRSIDAWPVGRPFPIHDRMQAITLDVILRTVFGLDEGALLDRLRERLRRLEYLDAVVKETARLSPVIPQVSRRLQAPMRIGGCELPAGVVASPCIYLTHRRSDLWPDPERFEPERFIGVRPNPYAFFPFGGGVRRCIGATFATYEMKIVLAEVLSRVELRAAPGHTVRTVRRTVTLAPSGGMPVVVDRVAPARAQTQP